MTALITASDRFRQLAGALQRFAGARLRRAGLQKVHPQWQQRAEVCERCPMRVIRCGISYCGNPFLEQIDRDPAIDGCGCPCREKAQSPAEHCPVDPHHRAAQRGPGPCSCKWCQSAAALQSRPHPSMVPG
ncbi:MAG: hypothetical protein ABSF29_16790 [Tepidisphaeraceae bacterium]